MLKGIIISPFGWLILGFIQILQELKEEQLAYWIKEAAPLSKNFENRASRQKQKIF